MQLNGHHFNDTWLYLLVLLQTRESLMAAAGISVPADRAQGRAHERFAARPQPPSAAFLLMLGQALQPWLRVASGLLLA